MTSTIKVNTVTVESGCTMTLGESGKTVALASGASQTGFGRTGTVNWDTTKKTAGFTGVSGNGYFIDTSSGAITVNLPASPSAGDIMALADYAGTAATNNITVGRNGSNIEGVAEDGVLTANRESKTLVFVDATQGWVPVNDNFDEVKQIKFVAATGGAEATSGNFKIHTFTGPGTFCVSCAGNPAGSSTVDYLVVAGGGGGGRGCSHGGGGGAGGYRESPGTASGCYSVSPLGTAPAVALPVTATGFPITVGGGGSGAAPGSSPNKIGSNGSNSIFSTITSTGGGGGAGWSTTGGNPGGSGGGGACSGTPTNVGTGNTPSVSPPQGNPGGPSSGPRMGGGGGAGEAGNTDGPGHGGDGVASSINGTPTTRSGGGSGGGSSCSSASIPGGDGGGGTGSGSGNGGAATVNTGGGGGGSYNPGDTGGAGGSGIVIIRYKFQ